MHDLTPFERRLSERLAAELASTVRPFDPPTIAASAIGRRRMVSGNRSLVLLAATVALLIALVGGIIQAGAGVLDRMLAPKLPALPWPLTGIVTHPGSLSTMEVTGAVALADGRVFVLGLSEQGSAQIWDPRTGDSTPTQPMVHPRIPWSSVRLGDGRVLLTGGDSPEEGGPTAEIFDPQRGSFTLLDSRPTTVEASAVLLHDGRVLLSGGYTSIDGDVNGNRQVSFQAEIFDPATNSFTPTPPMNRRRAGHLMSVLSDGRVLLLGGAVDVVPGRNGRSDLQGQASVEVFDPGTGKFEEPRGQIVVNQTFDRWVTLRDDRVVLLRQPGLAEWPYRALPMTLHEYDPAKGVEKDGPVIPASAPFYNVQALVRLSDSRVFVYASDQASLITTPNGDVADKGWIGVLDVDTGELFDLVVREASSGVVVPLPGGRVLILGGFERTPCGDGSGTLIVCSGPSSAVDMVR